MSAKSTLIGIVAVVLLFLSLPVVYGQGLPEWLGGRAPLDASDELTYIADLDFWQRTPRERAVVANARFDLAHDLGDVPMQVGNWVGEDAPETNEEVMILLEPEQYIQRLYHDDQGRSLWLTMVGGRNSQPFHAPDICYDADGWQYNLGSFPTTLDDGGEIYGLWLDANKEAEGYDEPWEHVVYYFYLFPDAGRDQSNGIVLFKLTSGKYGTIEETLAMHADFTRQFFLAGASPTQVAQARQ